MWAVYIINGKPFRTITTCIFLVETWLSPQQNQDTTILKDFCQYPLDSTHGSSHRGMLMYIKQKMNQTLTHMQDTKFLLDVDFSYCWFNLVEAWYSLEQYIGLKEDWHYPCLSSNQCTVPENIKLLQDKISGIVSMWHTISEYQITTNGPLQTSNYIIETVETWIGHCSMQ